MVGPRYLRIAEELRAEIEGLGPDTLLASEHRLAERFRVSRVTVRRALGLLERGGLISRQRGRGTLVNPPKCLRRPLAYTLDEDLRRQGHRLETRVLARDPEARPPPFVREALGLGATARVQHLSLLRIVDGQVIAHEARYFALPVAKEVDPALFEARPVSAVVAQLVGMPITRLDWETELVPVSRDTAAVLGLVPGALVTSTLYTQYLENGWPVETGRVTYRVDRVRFRFSSEDTRWHVPAAEPGPPPAAEPAATPAVQ
jgi:GntR family transcriptional regulator